MYIWTPDHPLGAVMQASLFLVWIAVWAIVKIRWKKLTTYMAFLPMLVFSVISNMQVRNMLPDFLQDHSYRSSEELSSIVLIMSLLINYNSFIPTLTIFPPVILTAHILQVTETV